MYSSNIVNYHTLRTDKVIRYDELDSGFILRANQEMTLILRKIIRNQVETQKTSRKDNHKKKRSTNKQFNEEQKHDVDMAKEDQEKD